MTVDNPEIPHVRAYRAPMVRAWTFVAVLAALAAALWVGILMSVGPFERPFSVPWWALIPLVFLAESAVIHVTFRKDAHSFSLSEIVLIVGLFLSSPAALLVAQVIGNSASLVLGRRQVPIKVVFNVSQLVLVTGLATVVFRVLVNQGDPLGPTGWLAAIAASVTSIVVAELAINTIIRLTGGNLSKGEMLEAMALGSIGASLNAALGLIVVFIAWYDPRSLWLAALPPLLMYVAYRTHAVQRNNHKHLESMHAVTEAIHTAPDLAAALVDAAGSARELVAADWLEIIVFRDEELRPYQTIVQLNGLEEPMAPRSLVDELPPWWQSVIGDAESAIVHEASWSGVEGSPPVRKDLIVAPIVGTERLHGYVLAADRLGDVNVFGAADIQLLETVAKQVSVALDNGRLETSLATVTALKEQLEGMVRSKDQFVASVSHELRTPLTAVVGFAEQLDENLEIFEHSDLKEFIGLIAHESSTLSHIIEDLLVAARADIGTLAIHPKSLDATQAVHDLMDLRPKSPDTSPITVSGEPAQAWADPVRFRQVVRNLLTNAQRYGGDDIGIDIEERGNVITITVSDNGPGVPEGREHLIFEAYERGHEESTQPGSVGLGLAVSRQLARMMGGDLTYSRHNSRTRFEFTVPTFVDEGCRDREQVAGDPVAVGFSNHLGPRLY